MLDFSSGSPYKQAPGADKIKTPAHIPKAQPTPAEAASSSLQGLLDAMSYRSDEEGVNAPKCALHLARIAVGMNVTVRPADQIAPYSGPALAEVCYSMCL